MGVPNKVFSNYTVFMSSVYTSDRGQVCTSVQAEPEVLN